jgi:hypothetical protein
MSTTYSGAWPRVEGRRLVEEDVTLSVTKDRKNAEATESSGWSSRVMLGLRSKATGCTPRDHMTFVPSYIALGHQNGVVITF